MNDNEIAVSAHELAKQLGVPPRCIKTAATLGDLPALRCGRVWRFFPSEVMAALGLTYRERSKALSVDGLARELDVTPQYIRKAARLEHIPALRFGKLWWFYLEDVVEALRLRRRRRSKALDAALSPRRDN